MSAPVILTSFGWTGEEGSAGGFLVARRDRAPANEQAFTGAFPRDRRRPVGIPGKRSARQVIAQGDPRSTRVGTRNDSATRRRP